MLSGFASESDANENSLLNKHAQKSIKQISDHLSDVAERQMYKGDVC